MLVFHSYVCDPCTSISNLSTEIKPIYFHCWSTHDPQKCKLFGLFSPDFLIILSLKWCIFWQYLQNSWAKILLFDHTQTKCHCSTSVCIPYIMIALQWNMIHRINLAKCIVHYLICTYFPAIWYIISNKNWILGQFGHLNTHSHYPFESINSSSLWIFPSLISFSI